MRTPDAVESNERGPRPGPAPEKKKMTSPLPNRMKSLVLRVALGLPISLFLGLPGVARADRWENEKGKCEATFKGWRTESLDRLRDCTMRWEMFRDITKVDDNTRTIVQEALEKLYQEGSERDAIMALSALKRMGLRPSNLRAKTAAVPKAAPPKETAPVVEADPEAAPPKVAKASRATMAEEVPGAGPAEAERAPSRREAKAHIERGAILLPVGQ